MSSNDLLEECGVELTKFLTSYFAEKKWDPADLIHSVHNLSKRREIHVWRQFFLLLSEFVRKPQPMDRVRSCFTEMVVFFITESAEELICTGLGVLLNRVSRANPNYALLLETVAEAIATGLGDHSLKDRLLELRFCSHDESITRKYLECTNSIFALDFLANILFLRIFTALFLEERPIDAERRLLDAIQLHVPFLFLWSFVLVARPSYLAMRNLIPRLAFSKERQGGIVDDLREILVFLQIAEAKGICENLSEMARDPQVPSWFGGFWRAVLLSVPGVYEQPPGKKQTLISEEGSIYAAVVECLFPSSGVFADIFTHKITLLETPKLTRFFGTPSRRLFQAILCFDIEYVYDTERSVLCARHDLEIGGFLGLLLFSQSEGSSESIAFYLASMEALHQKYIADEKLNLSLIALFRFTFASQRNLILSSSFYSVGNESAVHPSSVEQSRRCNSILLFVAPLLELEQLLHLGNEFLLLERILREPFFLIESVKQVFLFNWREREILRHLIIRILSFCLAPEVQLLDTDGCLAAHSLVHRNIDDRGRLLLRDLFKSIFDLKEQSLYAASVFRDFSVACLGASSSCGEDFLPPQRMLSMHFDQAEIESYASLWYSQLVQYPSRRYLFLSNFVHVFTKRCQAKLVENCLFDEVLARLVGFVHSLFDVCHCEGIAAVERGAINYDITQFPFKILLSQIADENCDALGWLCLDTRVIFEWKQRFFLDALLHISDDRALKTAMSFSESTLTKLCRLEAVVYSTRILLDRCLSIVTLERFSLSMMEMAFSHSSPLVSQAGFEKFRQFLASCNASAFHGFSKSFFSFLEAVGRDLAREQLVQLAEFCLLLLRGILSRLMSDSCESLLEDFISHPAVPSVLSVANISLCKISVLQTERPSFFKILDDFLQSPTVSLSLKTRITTMLEIQFSPSSSQFSSIVPVINFNSPLCVFEERLIENFYRRTKSDEIYTLAVLHAENNPFFFCRLIGSRVNTSYELYRQLEKQLQRQGYTTNFVVACERFIQEYPDQVRSAEGAIGILVQEKFLDMVFWKKLSTPAWLAFFRMACLEQPASARCIGTEFVRYLEGNMQKLVWMLELLVPSLVDEALEGCARVIRYLSESSLTITKSIMKFSGSLNLYLQACIEACKKAPHLLLHLTQEFTHDDFVRSLSAATYHEYLSLIAEFTHPDTLIDGRFLDNLVQDLTAFIENPIHPETACLKYQILLQKGKHLKLAEFFDKITQSGIIYFQTLFPEPKTIAERRLCGSQNIS